MLKGSIGKAVDSGPKPKDHEEPKKPTGRNIQKLLRRGDDVTGTLAVPKANDQWVVA